MEAPSPGLTPLGDTAVVFARPPEISAAVLCRGLREQVGVLDVVVSEQRVAVYFDPHNPPQRLQEFPALCARLEQEVVEGRVHRIAVRYNGEDLAAVAEACGLAVAEVIDLHTQAQYRVGLLGFLPGFAYLQGLPEALILPRRTQPRARIPAGAVAIAGGYSAIYPCALPGGWNLLGTAEDAALITASGARLQPGDTVIFEALR